jgi:hypothetical protein
VTGHDGTETNIMALSFGQHDIIRFKQHADRMTARARAVMEKTDEAVASFITTSEVSASSFLFGLAQGKFGGIAIFGVPVDLLTGLALHVAAFAAGGKYKNLHHLHAFADGALASFFGGLGRQVGRQIQTPADVERMMRSGRASALPDGKYTVGGVTGGASLADEELARMVAAGR